ncbi:hypothetical protein EZJ19_01525, partial [Parasulfuritortus cantonensis]
RGTGGTREVSWDDDVSSLVLRHPGRVDLGRIGDFVEGLLEAYGNDMLRYKGILAIADRDERLIFQGVHRITGFDYGRPWAEGECPECLIVIIGRRLDDADIRSRFARAVGQDATSTGVPGAGPSGACPG